MFLEQLSILEGRFLLNWHAIKHKSFTCNSTCIPKWYKILQPIVLESNDGSNLEPYDTESNFWKDYRKHPNYNQIIIEHWIINNIFSTTDIPIIQKCN
ncbi:19983_t:CDS:2, partial [Entrophospora sp. SA101]